MHGALRKARAVIALLLLATTAPARDAGIHAWETWDGCRLEADQYFDGDSFHVKHGRSSAILRLYFVDAPETDPGLAARLAEQAAYFGTATSAILHAGAAARAMTARFLAQPFRVITRRQVAPGASRSERYYGTVEKGGRRLDALLVAAGLARVGGDEADFPTAAAGQRVRRDLRALEEQAAKARRGLWRHASPSPARLRNLNTASAAELESLPGIGPKLAEQIIRARPLKNLAALDALPGIGPKKIEALRELVGF